MRFDADRLAELAGIRGTVSNDSPAAQERQSSSVLREGATRRAAESPEIERLKSIIRQETRSMIAEARAQRSAAESGDLQRIQGRRSLREAAAMGFYGPGFAGSPRPVLGGPLSSSGRLFGINESSIQSAASNVSQKDIENLSSNLGISLDPSVVDRVLQLLDKPSSTMIRNAEEKAEILSQTDQLEEGFLTNLSAGMIGTGAAITAGMPVLANIRIDDFDPEILRQIVNAAGTPEAFATWILGMILAGAGFMAANQAAKVEK